MGDMKPQSRTATSHWRWKLLILAPAVAVAVFSVNIIDELSVRMFSIMALLLTAIIWCGAYFMRVPWQRTWKSLSVSLALSLSVLFFSLPFKTIFLISKPTMNDLAARISQGAEFNEPLWAGLYRFESARRWGPMQCLWSDNALGDLEGFCHLAKGNPADHINEWSIASLGDGWYYIIED